MAKMLMGQIDHARDRIKELAKLKLTDAPKKPELVTASDVLSSIKKGETTVSATQLKKAFDNYVNGVPIQVVKSESGYYNHSKRRHEEGNSYVGDDTPSSVEEAIRNVIYEKQIKAGVAAYVAEKTIFDEKKAIIMAKATETEDLIVLGDQQAAQAALQAFADFQP